MVRRSLLITALLLFSAAFPSPAKSASSPDTLDGAARRLNDWNTSFADREAAMATLRNAGLRALDHVRALLNSKIWTARRDALTVASQIDAPDLREMTAAALSDSNWAVRAHAASAASDARPVDRAKLEPALKALLDDRLAAVRLAAYKTLTTWHPDGGYISDALSDPHPKVSYWAASKYIEQGATKALSPAVKTKFVHSVIATSQKHRWENIGAAPLRALLSFGPDARDALYHAITAEPSDVQASAVASVGSAAGKAGVDLMFQFLTHPNNKVRHQAISSISTHCGKEYGPRLLELARSSDDDYVQSQALRTLGKLKHKPAIPHLLQIARHRDSKTNIRRYAFAALAQVGDETTAQQLIAIYRKEPPGQQRRNMVQPIAALLKQDAAEFLKQAVEDPDQSVGIQALYAARSYLNEEDKTAIFIRVIKEGQTDRARQTAIRYLGPSQVANAADALISALEDGGPQTRSAAASALGRVNSLRAASAIVRACETEENPQVRVALINSLGQVRHKHAVPLLKKVLTSPDARVRAAALTALSRFGGALSDKFLIRLVRKEEHLEVLKVCVNLINDRDIRDARLLPRLPKLLEAGDGSLRLAAINCISKIEGAGATKALCRAIRNETYSAARQAAVNALVSRLSTGKLQPAAVTETLGEALQTTDPATRLRIVEALAKVADDEMAPLLIGILRNDTAGDVRRAAARAVRQIADEEMAPQLLEAAQAEDKTETIVLLIDLLAGLEDRRALPFFRKSLRAADPLVQGAALRAVGSFSDASLVPFYVDLLKRSTSTQVRLSCLRNISGKADRRTVGPLLLALEDDDPRVRSAAVGAVVQFCDAEVAAVLAAMLCQHNVPPTSAEAITQLLGRTRLKSVADTLLEAVGKTTDERLLCRLYQALGEMGERRAAPRLAAVVKANQSEELTKTAMKALVAIRARQYAPLCRKVARSSFGEVSRVADWATARLGASADGFELLVQRFKDGTDYEKRFYAPLLARAKDGAADHVLRDALAHAGDESLAATLCSALSGRSEQNAEVLKEVAISDVGRSAEVAAIDSLVPAGGQSVEEVLRRILASSRSAEVRAKALLQLSRSLAAHPEEKLAPNTNQMQRLLVKYIESPEPELRLAAVRSVAIMHPQGRAFSEKLIGLVEQRRDLHLRAEAVKALGTIQRSEEAEAALLEILDDAAEEAPVAEAVRSLGRMRSADAVEKLSQIATSGRLRARLAAVTALGEIGTPAAMKAVEQAFDRAHADAVCAAAARALGETGNRGYVPRLIQGLKSAPGLEVRAACAEALGQLGGDDATAALREGLTQDSGLVREQAVRALSAAGASRAAPAVARMLDDTDVRVAAAAKEVAAELSETK